MQFVIAGSYAEYHEFLRRKNLPRYISANYIFISDPMRLYGMTDAQVLSVGQYWKSPVYTFHNRDRIERNIRFVNESGKEV